MNPSQLKDFAGSALSTLGFGSNFWFWIHDDYWAEASSLKPLLHTWSLAVEEQFYLFFPLALLVAYKWMRRHLFRLLTLLFLVSLAAAQWLSPIRSELSFYLLPTRGWELLAGALLALLEFKGSTFREQRFDPLLTTLGLGLILGALFLFDRQMTHPGLLTLIPILGSVLVIAFGGTRGMGQAWLASRPMVWIGLVSYAFYLWHYPIFAFFRLEGSYTDPLQRVLWILIALALAVANYHLVERHTRKKEQLSSRWFFPLILLVALLLAGMNLKWYLDDASRYDERFSSQFAVDFLNFEEMEGFTTHPSCWISKEDYDPVDPFGKCRQKEGVIQGSKLMVLGDSNSASLIPGLKKELKEIEILQRAINSCPISMTHGRDFCKIAMQAAFEDILDFKPDLILILTRYLNQNHFRMLQKSLQGPLAPLKDRVVIMGPLPRWGHPEPGKKLGSLTQIMYEEFQKNPEGFTVPKRRAPHPATFQLEAMAQETAQKAGVEFLSVVEVFCDERQECLVKLGEEADSITTWDYGHLTEKASLYLGKRLVPQIEALLRKKGGKDERAQEEGKLN